MLECPTAQNHNAHVNVTTAHATPLTARYPPPTGFSGLLADQRITGKNQVYTKLFCSREPLPRSGAVNGI